MTKNKNLIVAPVRNTLKPMYRLLEQPLNHARVVVAEADDVVQRREAVRLARLLHLVQRTGLELVVLDRAPVVMRAIHGEARRQRSIRANDQRVLPGAAVPILKSAAHELLHLGNARRGVRHLVAGSLLGDQPIEQLIYLIPVLLGDVRRIVFKMLEMLLLRQRRLTDVIVRGHAIVVRDLRQLADIVHVDAEDVDIDKD